MDLGNQVILLSALLILLSIFAGLLSSRLGAPLLLVFLALGMLAGEDGPGGITFDDFHTTYLVGSVALAIILFDGGLRTPRANMRIARWPALALATVGVIATAVPTGLFAMWIFELGWLEGLLVGSIVASTDAAAVFLLLHTRGMRLRERVGATLELESGLNDPMAMFLTLATVELIQAGVTEIGTDALLAFAVSFAIQLAGGLVFGIVGGWFLLILINRVEFYPGLYPVLATTTAVMIYGGAQTVGASGFLAVFLAGYVVGNRRHRATQLINRFQDGLAWLSQIAMFLLLGLLVTPSALLPLLLPSLAVALFLILVGRPLAVLLCLAPFRFEPREIGFVSWVGLRGAVAIFLGTIPVLAELEGAMGYFTVAYVCVLTSLVVQGWTIGQAARLTGVELPPRPPAPTRVEFDLPADAGRDIVGYGVQPRSMAVRRPLARLPFPPGASLVTVLRDGVVHVPAAIERLSPGDHVLVIAPAEAVSVLDRLFATREAAGGSEQGAFVFDADAPLAAVLGFYGVRVPANAQAQTIGAFVERHLGRRLRSGQALGLGDVLLIVRGTEEGRVKRVAIELDPPRSWRHRLDPLRIWWRASLDLVRDRLRGSRRRSRAGSAATSGSLVAVDDGAQAGGDQLVVFRGERHRVDEQSILGGEALAEMDRRDPGAHARREAESVDAGEAGIDADLEHGTASGDGGGAKGRDQS